MRQKHTRDTIRPDMLRGRVMIRPREYSDLTGTPLPTVYKYIAGGQLKSSRMGSTIRIPVTEITGRLG